MEAKLFLKLFRISLLILLPATIFAQEWTKVKTLKLDQKPVTSAVDIQGNIFIGFSDGRLSKYNSSGKLLENFSLSNNSAITLIDVQNNLKPFVFYFDNQQITILDRFSSVPKTYFLEDFSFGFAMMACPTPDGDFWILENNPQRLKKINFNRKSAVLEVQTSLGDSIIRMIAYQNLLIIGDEDGLHLYDQFGGFVRSIPVENLINYHIRDGVLFAFTSQSIIKFHLSKVEILSSVKLPLTRISSGLRLKDDYIFVRNKELIFYQLLETK